MSDMSDYLEEQTYNFWFRPFVGAPSRPISHTVSLWSAVVDAEAGDGTELTGGTAPGYARPAVTFGPPVDGVGSNDSPVMFPIAAGDWPQATHYGIHDNLGNLLQKLRPLPAPITVTTGNRAVAEIGDLLLVFS